MSETTVLESMLRRDRAVVTAGLVGVSALAWVYLVVLAAGMDGMAMDEAVMSARAAPWSVLDFVLMVLMWAVMMVGMMVPSAAPMILLYARLVRTQAGKGRVLAPTGVFAGGYVLVWTLFSVAAASLQWALEQVALLSPLMTSTSSWLGAGLLIAAGAYQLTPLKLACLKHCRSPIHFLATRWRDGTWGALRMGLEHGAYCVGCCWFLMALLFVGGVMNLLWVAAIAALVLIEKVLRTGLIASRLSGALLVLAGLAMAVAAAR